MLELCERPVPTPGPREVRVRVMSSGLNRADILQRRGLYPAPPGVPVDIPGLEFAGTVEAVGSECRRIHAGDPVMGLVAGGACADYLVVHEDLVMTPPTGLSWAEAAAIPEAFMTAFDAMILQGGLRRDGSVIIIAASSGVGTAAVQLARWQGSLVIGSTRSAFKVDRLRAIGLARPVVGGAEALVEAQRARVVGGVDVILDLVGGPATNVLMKSLAPRGRHIVVGLMGGTRTELNLALLLQKRASIHGTTLRSRPLAEKRELVAAFTQRVLPGFSAGDLHPMVDRTFLLQDIRLAHEALESQQHVGKIVLRHDEATPSTPLG